MESEEDIRVDVVSDVVCPWCYVGQRNLQRALVRLGGAKVSVSWRPYQLDPTIPPGGRDRDEYLLDKFGSRERIDAMHERLREIGAAAGIAFAFEAIRITPNTLDAHRLIRWAAAEGTDVQGRLVARLFRLYFEEGGDIGAAPTLLAAARAAGMDTSTAETLLPTPADAEEVKAEIATAQHMGVTGVPCFLLEGRYALMGAQPPERLADAIAQVRHAKARGELDDPSMD
ncbi:DsbA family oxidoreductase [Chelativorans sp. M5D2P16]|uniref:DsbA family oxidoreductase n=1 Tax=Chelativorans sp. M5D2P16 TaxID=3095678 RepID=UPI002ACAF576|nr:DsbA family oxidoreductase [Chelativorans sp. M5D2P16]MDZ5697680.1 DsbA family oxidoreductase [Chelativorans sp. M5D2P16]